MKPLYPIIYLCLLLLIFSDCKGKPVVVNEFTEEDDTPLTLSLQNISNIKGEELLSSITSNIEYVSLETKAESLLRQVLKLIILNNGNFVITDGQRLQLFSPTGKYIRSISKQGNGPADFVRISTLAANHITGGFFLHTNKKVVEFDADGNFINNFEVEHLPMDMIFDSEGRILLHRMSLLKSPEDTIPSWFLYRYDTSGKEIKRIKDISPRIRKENTISYVVPSRPLYIFDNKIRFNEFGNDTIFTIEEDILSPYAIIDLGKMRMSATPEGVNIDAVDAELRKKLFLTFLHEDEQFFYMGFGWGFGGKYLYCTYNKKSGKMVNYGNGEFLSINKGLTNDIDGGPPFYPLTIDPTGVRVMWWNADSFKKNIINKEYETEKEKYGDKFEKVYQLANSLKEDDNPVLLIVK